MDFNKQVILFKWLKGLIKEKSLKEARFEEFKRRYKYILAKKKRSEKRKGMYLHFALRSFNRRGIIQPKISYGGWVAQQAPVHSE